MIDDCIKEPDEETALKRAMEDVKTGVVFWWAEACTLFLPSGDVCKKWWVFREIQNVVVRLWISWFI